MAAVGDVRQPTVIGTAFAIRDPWPWPEFARLARHGDQLGYRAVFLPEIAGRDAFAALTGLADETTQLQLGTGVVPMTSRRASLTAMGAATVHERSGGRAILGLGTGAPRPGALDELRAQVGEIRALLHPGAGREAGEGPRLGLDRPVPVWLAALGPRAVALAGEIADGVLLNWCTPERVADARAGVRAAAERAGRDPDSVTIAAYIRSAVASGETWDTARAALALAAGEYASYPAYRRQFEAMGVGRAADAAAEARAGHRGPPPGQVAPLLDAVCLHGEPETARARLGEFREAGCDLPVIYPVPFDARPGLESVGSTGVASVSGTLQALAPA
jgi:alkanesulfonate monooxygenase SsuD/methylene tetrahydromethanopterin reductase-like flavin-dependent oxidoreductase (luciferase family)